MGQSIAREEFDGSDGERFRERLDDSLAALAAVLEREGFGAGEPTLGAELELGVIDGESRPLPLGAALIEEAADSRLTHEINLYNLEANLTPQPFAGTPFGALEREIVEVLERLNGLGAAHGGARVIPVGILPTLRPRDLRREMITPDARYEVLTEELRRRRGEKFRIEIEGREALHASTDSVAPEGANTSLQIHYRAHPERFVDLYNAVQLVTPLLVGVAANSPFLLGRELWQETRIALFRQAVDGRDRHRRELGMPPRVHIGHGWLRRSALEAFIETVSLYDPLLPICAEDAPRAPGPDEPLPALEELALQCGTVWSWNRVIYDPHEEGHLRVELRALPAGPSPCDMAANAALAIGLAESLIDGIDALLPSVPHQILERNLEAAARGGLEARVLWPAARSHRLDERRLGDVVAERLPEARAALEAAGVDAAESARLLDLIEARLARGRSGASWQVETFHRLRADGLSRKRALRAMLDRYATKALANLPLAEW